MQLFPLTHADLCDIHDACIEAKEFMEKRYFRTKSQPELRIFVRIDDILPDGSVPERAVVKALTSPGPGYREATISATPTKVCTRCLKEKPLTEFHITKNSKDGHHSICKRCRKLKYAEIYESKKANPNQSETPVPED